MAANDTDSLMKTMHVVPPTVVTANHLLAARRSRPADERESAAGADVRCRLVMQWWYRPSARCVV